MSEHTTLESGLSLAVPTRSEIITSQGNPWLKQLRNAAARSSLAPGGFALAESPHLLHEALRSGVEIGRVFASERVQPDVAAILPPHRRIPLHTVSDRLFGSLATTSRNQGVLALVKLPSWEPARVLGGLTVALDGVQDPGNAGMIMRTAEAFGASGVVFLKGSAAPTNPKALRASAGSAFRLPFLQKIGAEEFLGLARSHGKSLLCAVARADCPLAAADLSARSALVIGSEGRGPSPVLAAAAPSVGIPSGRVESLNAAVAAAVILYEFARRSAPG